MITLDELRSVLEYNSETGKFTWLKSQGLGGRNGKVGDLAGSLSVKGYWVIRLNRKLYYAHRLAWFYKTGYFPYEVDHVNLNRLDNRWCNLREATRSNNSMNVAKRNDNTSGYKGVTLDKRIDKWRARINLNKQEIFLGHFDTKELAYAAYCEAAENKFKSFARLK